MSLMVKKAPVDFVTEEFVLVVGLAAVAEALWFFVNNVGSVTPGQGEVATNAVLEHFVGDDHHFSEKWKGTAR